MENECETLRDRVPETPEARENQMICLAIDLAEQKLRDGTASSQLICHYLKAASSRERLEMEQLRQQNKLLEAKTEALNNAQSDREMMEAAMNAMKSYRGL